MFLKVIFKTAALFTTPVFTGLWNFLFHNTIGRNITNAFLTTAALSLIVIAADRAGWLLPLASGRHFAHFVCAGYHPTVDHMVSRVGIAVLDE